MLQIEACWAIVFFSESCVFGKSRVVKEVVRSSSPLWNRLQYPLVYSSSSSKMSKFESKPAFEICVQALGNQVKIKFFVRSLIKVAKLESRLTCKIKVLMFFSTYIALDLITSVESVNYRNIISDLYQTSCLLGLKDFLGKSMVYCAKN